MQFFNLILVISVAATAISASGSSHHSESGGHHSSGSVGGSSRHETSHHEVPHERHEQPHPAQPHHEVRHEHHEQPHPVQPHPVQPHPVQPHPNQPHPNEPKKHAEPHPVHPAEPKKPIVEHPVHPTEPKKPAEPKKPIVQNPVHPTEPKKQVHPSQPKTPEKPSPAVTTSSSRKINDAGLELIKKSEGFRGDFYKDAVGIKTIGYGHACHASDCSHLGKMNEKQASDLLRSDLSKYENFVHKHFPNVDENKHAALVSFAYNLGTGALEKSTLAKHVKEGNYKAAANEFSKWTHAGGKVLPGLVTRRNAERELFCKSGC